MPAAMKGGMPKPAKKKSMSVKKPALVASGKAPAKKLIMNRRSGS